MCSVDFDFNFLHCYFSIILCVQYPISISFNNIFIQIPWRFSIAILIGAPDGVRGVDCMPSDDGVCSESKTDTGHECETYMWFDTGLMLSIFVNLTPVDI